MAGSGGRIGDRSGAVLRARGSAEPSVLLPALAPPANGPLTFNPPPAVESWLDGGFGHASGANKLDDATVTVTPRPEQELR
jgi:hypothetical protein